MKSVTIVTSDKNTKRINYLQTVLQNVVKIND